MHKEIASAKFIFEISRVVLLLKMIWDSTWLAVETTLSIQMTVLFIFRQSPREVWQTEN